MRALGVRHRNAEEGSIRFMPFEMTLWRVSGSKLDPIAPAQLEQEQRLEDWIANDPSILGMDIALRRAAKDSCTTCTSTLTAA